MSIVEALRKHDDDDLLALAQEAENVSALEGQDRGERLDYSKGMKMRRPYMYNLALKNPGLRQMMGGHTPLDEDEFDNIRQFLRIRKEAI